MAEIMTPQRLAEIRLIESELPIELRNSLIGAALRDAIIEVRRLLAEVERQSELREDAEEKRDNARRELLDLRSNACTVIKRAEATALEHCQAATALEVKLRIATDALRNISMLSVSDESCCRWAHGQAMIALTRLKAGEGAK